MLRRVGRALSRASASTPAVAGACHTGAMIRHRNPENLPCTCGCHAMVRWLGGVGWKCTGCWHVVSDERFTAPIRQGPVAWCIDCERPAEVWLDGKIPLCRLHAEEDPELHRRT